MLSCTWGMLAPHLAVVSDIAGEGTCNHAERFDGTLARSSGFALVEVEALDMTCRDVNIGSR